ncbi:hypothetical protein FB446DRAFT_654531 [Lentinula raphanica]|nr:hypothetical protein FB446DRAFT_654531 [Lentinula raphanica]
MSLSSSFDLLDIPKDIILLITDQLHSPGDFALYRSLISHIKQNQNQQRSSRLRVVISTGQHISRWDAILAKSNVNLSQQIAAKTVHFVDMSSSIPQAQTEVKGEKGQGGNPFNTLFKKVASLFDQFETTATEHDTTHRGAGAGALVILDDVSVLEWIGYETMEIVRLCRALRALCIKNQATLVIRNHVVVTPGELDPLFRHLYSLCTYHLDVQPLTSGRSGDVSGQVALHHGPNAFPASTSTTVKTRQRSAALHYRLTDGAAVFFERGSSRGVL